MRPQEDRNKTTFTSHHGMYRFTRMTFGLKNAPRRSNRALDVILSKMKWQYFPFYLDDVIIFSNSVQKHFGPLIMVLNLVSAAGVSLKLEKCVFFGSSVNYLGNIIRSGNSKCATGRAMSSERP